MAKLITQAIPRNAERDMALRKCWKRRLRRAQCFLSNHFPARAFFG